MSRLLSTMKNDIVVQFRNNLYSIGIGVSVVLAIAISQLAKPTNLAAVVPTLLLLVIGGTTLLYVAGMVIFERDEGTLNALIVSPLRPSEYLWSKIMTLTLLATLEAFVMIAGAMAIMRFSAELALPNIPLLLIGVFAIGIIYTLIGIILIVRYDQITDFLMPMAGVAVILQLPFLYFFGLIKHPAFLLIPTSPPALIMQRAYLPLPNWQVGYAFAYTSLLIAGLAFWALRSFKKHVIMQVG